MIKTDPSYTEHEVSRILRESEGRSIDRADLGEGHAERQHELQARGKNRASTTVEALQLRIVGYDIFEEDEIFIRQSGAFDGCQAAAITFALNKKGGGAALGFLCRETCKWVVATIDVAAGGFRMLGYDVSDLEPASSGTRFVAGPNGLILPGILREKRVLAGGIKMKLMKTVDKSLHIRTAFPLAVAPSPQIADVQWNGVGIQRQILPV